MQLKRISAIAGLMLALTSCASNYHPSITTASIDNANNVENADIKLSEAAVSVGQSLQELAATERAANPEARLPNPPDPASIGLGELASVDWTGPLEPLVRKIANATHYRVRVLGKAPSIPVIISVTAQNIPFADILRDISFQAQNKASIVLYPNSKVLELRYRG